ncbi:hypothetical protein [Oceanicaulis sp.]|uniref:hypothetical protein n=1 Tax=Oceanicaulis sp. TaxID=1924941 RepID=UPI003F729A78
MRALKLIAGLAAGLCVLVSSQAFGASLTTTNNYYYVDFYMDNVQVGHGEVHCADQPFEYILIWGINQGERVVSGRENCPSLPFPF